MLPVAWVYWNCVIKRQWLNERSVLDQRPNSIKEHRLRQFHYDNASGARHRLSKEAKPKYRRSFAIGLIFAAAHSPPHVASLSTVMSEELHARLLPSLPQAGENLSLARTDSRSSQMIAGSAEHSVSLLKHRGSGLISSTTEE
ncbi:hypothetical protein D7Y53_23695 [Stenotrophomonas maltophilia]|nr:hypothetical protein [Stenotrophomonas maltophilia]